MSIQVKDLSDGVKEVGQILLLWMKFKDRGFQHPGMLKL